MKTNYPCFRYNLKFEEKKVNSNNVERREQEEASSDDYSSTNEDDQVRALEVQMVLIIWISQLCGTIIFLDNRLYSSNIDNRRKIKNCQLHSLLKGQFIITVTALRGDKLPRYDSIFLTL